MSKYNNIKSIPIDSLSDEELKIAMKEWAEGDDSMEALLWAFYNKGITTSGCHAGAGSYVSMDYDVDKKGEFSLIMNTVLSFPGSQILIRPDGGNPHHAPSAARRRSGLEPAGHPRTGQFGRLFHRRPAGGRRHPRGFGRLPLRQILGHGAAAGLPAVAGRGSPVVPGEERRRFPGAPDAAGTAGRIPFAGRSGRRPAGAATGGGP